MSVTPIAPCHSADSVTPPCSHDGEMLKLPLPLTRSVAVKLPGSPLCLGCEIVITSPHVAYANAKPASIGLLALGAWRRALALLMPKFRSAKPEAVPTPGTVVLSETGPV